MTIDALRCMRAAALTLACALLPLASEAAPSATDASAQGALLPRDSRDAGIFRGGLVYANYCVTCHGFNADGNGRAARLYNPRPANLRMSDKNDARVARRWAARNSCRRGAPSSPTSRSTTW